MSEDMEISLETLVQTVALGAIFPKTFTEDWSKEDLS
jgi:hypothetical protein